MKHFKLNQDADINGTHLVGHITTTFGKLLRAFGEPMESDGYKVSGEWAFEDSEGNVFTIYDWKQTNLYEPDYPSVENFRASPYCEFHIGGNTNPAEFINFLESKLASV